MSRLPAVFARHISHAIHGPLPLDPAKTKRLLAALTASFQRHLDAAHPTPSTPAPAPSASSSNTRPLPASAFHASASHYANILQHPAFTIRPDPEVAALHRLQGLLLQDDPSAPAIQGCLAALAQRPATSAPGGLAAKILSMFRAGDRVSLLYEPAAAKDFGRLALRDDRADLVLQLVQEWPNRVAVALVAAFLVEKGPHEALRFIVSAHSGIGPDAGPKLDGSYARCLQLFCRYLLAHPEAIGQVRPKVYDQVMRHEARWGAKITPFYKSTLELFNPATPKCGPALALIQKYEKASDKPTEHWTIAYRRGFIRFSFRLAQLLIQHGRYKDADFVLDFCKYTFPEELASEESRLQKEVDESVIASKVVGLLGI
jgi:hypothetical protein